MLCLCAAQLKFWFQTDPGRENLASYYRQGRWLLLTFLTMVTRWFILGDPGADSAGEEKSKRAGKYGTKKSKKQLIPAGNSWLNFRVRGQFEIKSLIVRHINTTYFISIKKN